MADFNGNVLGVRNAPLNPSFLAYKSQFDLYSANTVIYNLIAHCHWAMLNLSGLWEGEGGRGPLLLPALGKRTAGHLVLQAYDDFADVLLLLTPAGSCLQRGTGCLPLSRQWVIPVISLCFSAAPASPFPASYCGAAPLGKGLMGTQQVSSSSFLSAAFGRMYAPCSGML